MLYFDKTENKFHSLHPIQNLKHSLASIPALVSPGSALAKTAQKVPEPLFDAMDAQTLCILESVHPDLSL